MLESKGVSAITRPNPGYHCIAVPGVDAASTPLIPAVDWSTTVNVWESPSAMTDENNLYCPSGQFVVVTQRQPPTTVATPGGGTTSVPGNAVAADDVGFTFIVP